MASIKALRQHLETLRCCGITEVFNSPIDKAARLTELEQRYSTCEKCPLHVNRIKFVYGSGDPEARAMIIGEAPGEQENLTGKPFVGKAGELLDRMLVAIELTREQVYIANIVKCRPPANRNPETEERIACMPYLTEQIRIVKPKVILLMGLVAAQTILGSNQTMGALRLKVHEYDAIPVYVTYHPAALLRNPDWKAPAWEDLKKFRDYYQSL